LAYLIVVRIILATVVFLAVFRCIIFIAWYVTYAVLAIMALMLLVFVIFAITILYRWALSKRVQLFPANDLEEKLIDDKVPENDCESWYSFDEV